MLSYLPKTHFEIDAAVFAEPVRPSITGFARLETSPCTPGLELGLSAPVADPLWLVGRQWQFGELQGEDAGTPVQADLAVQAAPIDRWAPQVTATAAEATALDDAPGAPPEVRVEAESALATHPRLDADAGAALLRRCRAAGATALRDALRAGPFGCELPLPVDPPGDPRGLQWHLLLHGRGLSARRVRDALAPHRAADGTLGGLPASLAVPAADEGAARAVLAAWLAWLEHFVHDGPARPPAWRPDRFEYAFSLFAQGPTHDVALRADAYVDGHVDWHDFVAEGGAAHGLPAPAAPAARLQGALPVPVRYPGMPADRYWEFEDARVNFAGVEASPSSLVRLVMTEFALAYGQDWFLLPIDLPVGALYTVHGFEVRDSFGQPTRVRASDHAGAGPGQPPWRMYELATRGEVAAEVGDTLALPDTLVGTLQGAPLEELLLVRDEMANLAWGIERRVQGTSGEPLDRKAEAERLAFRQQLARAPDDPHLVYRLATPVPAHWIPLVPRSRGGPAAQWTIELRRAGMARFYALDPALTADPDYAAFLALLQRQEAFVEDGGAEQGVQRFVLHPRGRLLRDDPAADTAAALSADSLAIAEEEVPRAGACITRRFQYARGADGRAWLWIGRRKSVGGGEGASGLAFDSVRRRSAIG